MPCAGLMRAAVCSMAARAGRPVFGPAGLGGADWGAAHAPHWRIGSAVHATVGTQRHLAARLRAVSAAGRAKRQLSSGVLCHWAEAGGQARPEIGMGQQVGGKEMLGCDHGLLRQVLLWVLLGGQKRRDLAGTELLQAHRGRSLAACVPCDLGLCRQRVVVLGAAQAYQS